MGIIRQMPESLANQIAAGEVVERPASVVKELVENAIDAGANKVTVNLVEAGIAAITVTDDGLGMEPDDIALSVAAHATSKIYDVHDLFHIQSLGFRGEALASIASVSKLKISSRPKGAETGLGHYLTVHGSKVQESGPIAAPIGTTIEVRDLFYNTPARLKHLASIKTELKHSLQFMQQIALAYPHIRFQLIHERSTLFQSYGNGDLRQAIAAVYQPALAKSLIYFQAEDDDFQIQGYLSPPQITRTSKNYIHWLINGRVVQSYVLSQLLLKAYGRQLMIGRYPIAVIDIQLDPQLVDVNVHPTKQTVRLSKEGELGGLLSQAVKTALGQINPVPELDVQDLKLDDQPGPVSLHNSGPDTGHEPYPSHPWTQHLINEDLGPKPQAGDGASTLIHHEQADGQTEPVTNVGQPVSLDADNLKGDSSSLPKDSVDRVESGQASSIHQKVFTDVDANRSFEAKKGDYPSSQDPVDPSPDFLPRQLTLEESQLDQEKNDQASGNKHGIDFSSLRYVGQIHGTYLVAESYQGFYLIDQHAAQERIRYEALMKNQAGVYAQHQVLFPYVFEFSASEMMDIDSSLPKFEALGIFLEKFGPTSYQMEAYPDWMTQDRVESYVRDLVVLLQENAEISVNQLKEKSLIMQACRGAIKANQYLDDRQAKALILDLEDLDDPYHCPHGRPVFVSFDQRAIEKLFKRIQDSHQGGHQL